MQVDISENGTLGKTLSITWSPDEVHSRRQTVLGRLAERVKLPGFRPGKNHRQVIEKRYGAEATSQAEEELANDGLSKAIGEHKLSPIGPVKHLDSKRESGFTVTFAFEIRPSITLPDPKSIELPKEEISVTDAEIDEFIGSLARRAGQLSPLAEGETITNDDNITLTGKVLVGDETARDLHDFHHLVGAYPLLGKKPEDVVALLKDKGAGTIVEFETTLPGTFAPAAFAGKEAKVSVTVQSATRNRPAEIDEAFAKRMGMEDVAKLREAVTANLTSTKEGTLHQKQTEALVKALTERIGVELPPKLLENLIADRAKAAEEQAKQQQRPEGEIVKSKADASKAAEESLKRYIIIAAISDEFAVKVTREDMEGQIRMAAMRSGQTPEAIHKRLTESGQINQVLEEIREAKAIETFLEKALA